MTRISNEVARKIIDFILEEKEHNYRFFNNINEWERSQYQCKHEFPLLEKDIENRICKMIEDSLGTTLEDHIRNLESIVREIKNKVIIQPNSNDSIKDLALNSEDPLSDLATILSEDPLSDFAAILKNI